MSDKLEKPIAEKLSVVIALPEHKPLGVTNRLREVIYDHISRVRHEMNETQCEELLGAHDHNPVNAQIRTCAARPSITQRSTAALGWRWCCS